MKPFFERWTIVAAIAIVLAGCADAGDRLREIARVRSHLERVERELRASTPAGLNAAQIEKRAMVIQNLHRYINAERYPTNRISQEMTPIFIDGDGARCAVAALLEASGHHALVERIAGTQNLAYVEELKDEPELQAWLTDNGITLAEAARIQPEYTPPTDSWNLTAMLFGSVQGGAQAVLAPGARVGIRNSYAVPRGSACDHCVDRSWALMAEYRRDFLLSLGSTNQVSLLGQIELDGFHQPGHFNFVLGPVASFDEDDRPGRGYGGQLGFGYSLRRFSIRDQIPLPFFVEVISSLIHFDDGLAFHAGANLGVVW